MGLRVSFDLDDGDLRHFRLIMREARKTALDRTPEEIVAGAESLLHKVGKEKLPHFILERLDNLQLMIRMLADHEWRLPKQESMRVLNALAYFCEPDDLIPDHIPGLGFLDDAIMVELVQRDLRHEIDAYRDFCDYRANKAPAAGIRSRTSAVTREEWLEGRRKELHHRMRRRRKRSNEAGERPRLL